MKRSRPNFVFEFALTVLAMFATSGCGGFKTTETNTYQIPWPDENGTYHLQNVPVESYDHPSTLQGRYAQIMVNPSYKDGQLQGERAAGHYTRTRDGIMVSTDYTSIEAAAVHAHFERFAKMDAELDANSRWPARIALDINVVANGKRELNNAFYLNDLDAFFIPPFTALDVPVAVNGGALAHEHFHMIFHDAVLVRLGTGAQFPSKLASLVQSESWLENIAEEAPTAPPPEAAKPPSESSLSDRQIQNYNAFYIAALNEGLADFWAWVYTGDPEFIKASIPKINGMRRLDGPLEKQLDGKPQLLAWTRSLVHGKALTVEQMKASAYSVGTTYSRLMYKIAQATTPAKRATRDDRMKAAGALIKTLPAFADKIAAALRAKELINPNIFWATLYPNLTSLESVGSMRVCRMLRRFASPDFERELSAVACADPKAETPRSNGGPATPNAPGGAVTPHSGPQTPTTTPATPPTPVTPKPKEGDE